MTRKERRAQKFGTPSGSAPSSQAAAPDPQPVQQAPVVDETPQTVSVRTASMSLLLPYAVYNGRLQHPDTVLRDHGGNSAAFYRLMAQQNLSLSADMSQWEDRCNSISRRIRAGKAGDSISEQMALDCESIFWRLPSQNIVNTWILRARWYGHTAIGKAGWKKDEWTGIIAPVDLYNIDPWKWKFGPNFEPYLLTQASPWQGERVDRNGQPWERSVFFPRWGSNATGYGESDLRDIYLNCWYTQNVLEMLLHAIEVYGRPIPWIEIGSTLQGDGEFDDFEAGVAKQYKFYVITRTPNAPTSTTFPNASILANGSAGRSELEFIRYNDGLIQRKIHGTQQTQDKTGGSRALEDSRIGIAYDKTPPGSQLLDQAWTSGWLDDISRVNWPNQPRELWPVMDSDGGEIGKTPLTGPQILALRLVAEDLRLRRITRVWAVEQLVMANFDRWKGEEMVDSMLDANSGLSQEVMSPVSLDGFRIQQSMEAVNRFAAKAINGDTANILMRSAGIPPAWADAVVTSTERDRNKLTPVSSPASSPAMPLDDPPAKDSAATREIAEMSEMLALMRESA